MYEPDDTELEETEHEEEQDADQDADALVSAFRGLLALYLVLWSLHWSAKGDPSYGDHLLWERATKTTRKDVDRLAELVALFYGAEVLDPADTLDEVHGMSAYMEDASPASRALGMIEQVRELVVEAHDAAPTTNYDGHDLAVQNVLAGIADHLAELHYLAAQRLGGHEHAKAVLSRMR